MVAILNARSARGPAIQQSPKDHINPAKELATLLRGREYHIFHNPMKLNSRMKWRALFMAFRPGADAQRSALVLWHDGGRDYELQYFEEAHVTLDGPEMDMIKFTFGIHVQKDALNPTKKRRGKPRTPRSYLSVMPRSERCKFQAE